MNVETLLEDLRRRRIELWVEGEALKYRAPPGAFDAELRDRLRALKPAVVAALKGGAEPEPVQAPDLERFGTGHYRGFFRPQGTRDPQRGEAAIAEARRYEEDRRAWLRRILGTEKETER